MSFAVPLRALLLLLHRTAPQGIEALPNPRQPSTAGGGKRGYHTILSCNSPICLSSGDLLTDTTTTKLGSGGRKNRRRGGLGPGYRRRRPRACQGDGLVLVGRGCRGRRQVQGQVTDVVARPYPSTGAAAKTTCTQQCLPAVVADPERPWDPSGVATKSTPERRVQDGRCCVRP